MKLFRTKKQRIRKQREKGVALFIALVALLLLAAIATGMMFQANTESAINYNYRDAQFTYFAAGAGLEDAREMLRTDNVFNPVYTPKGVPAASNPRGIIYVLNPKGTETVAPWDSSNAYFDDELCHEYPDQLGIADTGVNVPCTAGAPGGSYTSVTSKVAVNGSTLAGSNSALVYKWVRISLKYNYTLVPPASRGTTPPSSGYPVDGSRAYANPDTLVCWENQSGHEFMLSGNQVPANPTAPQPSEFELAALQQAIDAGLGQPAVFMFGGKGKSTSTSGTTTGTTTSSTTGTTTGTSTTGTTSGTTSGSTSGTTTATTSGTTTGTTSGTTTSTTSGSTTGSTTGTTTATTSGSTTGTTTSTSGTTTGSTTGTTTSTTSGSTTGTTSGSTTGTTTGTTAGTTTGTTTTGTTSGTTTGGTSGTTGGTTTGRPGYYASLDDCNALNENRFSVYLVTSLAVSKRGAKRMAQYEISRSTFPQIPGGLTFNGPGATFVPPTSTNFSIDGSDHATASSTCNPKGTKVHAITAFSSADQSTIQGDINNPPQGQPHPTNYTGLGTDRPASMGGPLSPDAVDGSSTDPQTGYVPLAGLTTVKENTDLVDGLTSSADLLVPVPPGTTVTNTDVRSRNASCSSYPMGTTDPSAPAGCQGPKITVIQGNAKLTNAGGTGILVVTGDLTLAGNLTWDGLILVVGTGNLLMTGSGGKTVNGGIYVANTTAGASLGAVHVDTNGGGNGGIFYDSCKIANATANQSYRVITYREMTY